MTFEDILKTEPFALPAEEKEAMLTERLGELTERHRGQCREYGRMLDSLRYDPSRTRSWKDLPFLPVRLFKELELKSVPSEQIVKTMTSSGTTGQAVSRIYLDRTTSINQQKAMVKIVSDFTGSERMPMIIIDCPSVVKDRTKFSARGAGILGFSIFGAKKIYALTDDMQMDVAAVEAFLEKYRGEKILLFGFTFMIWQHFYKELLRLKAEGTVFDLSGAVLIHGGGWKKLTSEAVTPEEFRARLRDVCGLTRIHDYYGMVEQTGCIYMECECGHLHASVFSDVLARRPEDFSECAPGEEGILQVVSTLPESYPGHSLLTEDLGVILGEDDCPCGRKGKYFKLNGRLKNAEIRGCSDTYAAGFAPARGAEEPPRPAVARREGTGRPPELEKLQYLVGDGETILRMPDLPARPAFSDETLDFLNEISRRLLGSPAAKGWPDVVTLGFWLRKASLSRLKESFGRRDGNLRLGRGVAFHVAPSNVPVNYMYSLVSGLLTGNANIVRVPSKAFPQVELINAALEETLAARPDMRPYLALVRYERDRAVNDLLSSLADVRIVWGGDRTIEELRRSPLAPRATEITFADRYSLAVIDSGAYLAAADQKRTALDFYNDTFLTDQNACTSPRVVVWTGAKIREAKERFWKELSELVEKKYIFQPIQGVNKLTSAFLAACAYPGTVVEPRRDNRIVRVRVPALSVRLMDLRDNSGYFYEYECGELRELFDLCRDTHCQTLGYIGDKQMFAPLLDMGVKGIDRVVPVGRTMDFELIWDGYDLTERLTRTIRII